MSASAVATEQPKLELIDGGLSIDDSAPQSLNDLHGMWVENVEAGLDAIACVMAKHDFFNHREGEKPAFRQKKLLLRGGRSLDTAEMWHPGDQDRRAGQYRLSAKFEPAVREGKNGLYLHFECWPQGHRG